MHGFPYLEHSRSPEGAWASSPKPQNPDEPHPQTPNPNPPNPDNPHSQTLNPKPYGPRSTPPPACGASNHPKFDCRFAEWANRSLLSVRRTHQIRIHAKHAGFAIVGDNVYGRERDMYGDDEDLMFAGQK